VVSNSKTKIKILIMTHVTANGTTVPEFFISKNKNRLKIYDKKNVYLNNGDNFELEIFNNQTETIGVEILLNSKKISNSLLILRPAERIFLDRYLDESKKFLFETYEVKDTQKVRDIIANNGKIEIRCYKEQPVQTYGHISVGIPWNQPYWSTGTPYYYNNTVTTSSGNGTFNLSGGTITSSSCFFSSDINYNDKTQIPINSTYTTCSLDMLETGIVGKGDTSNQKFDYTNFNPQSCYFYNCELQILPASQKNKTIKEIKEYCTSCGYRVRNEKWKHCPNCGEKI
jgi:hypothetical protein